MYTKETDMEQPPIIANPDLETGHITVYLEGAQHTIHAYSPQFPKALDSLRNKEWNQLLDIINPSRKLQSIYSSYEGIEVKEGNVYVFGEQVHSSLSKRILSLLENNLDCVYLFKFVLKLNQNPSKRAVDELYTFLEHKCLPITDNGNFLAYKAVRNNYTDVHTGKFLNTVDSILEMPRNKVDDNKEIGCSYGFHAGTVEYAKNFMPRDGHLMLVEINPADVVSIPTDCNFQKLRTCKYKVVSEYEIDLNDPVYASRFQTDDYYDPWDDEDGDVCSDCQELSYGNCEDCDCCEGCCDCQDSEDDEELEDAYEPTEIQLTLNLDNKITEDNWQEKRFNYLKMLSYLYANRRPAVANALRDFYSKVDYQQHINPEFSVLLQFTSDEDAYKIYLNYIP